MANKITGKTDTTGNISVMSTSMRSILLVGEGIDTTKEVMFSINGTADAGTHFGPTSAFIDIVKVLIRNGVNNIKGICVGEYGVSKPYTTKALAYNAAYEKSMTDSNIHCIIIDSTDETLNAGLKEHLSTAETEDIFRYAVVGCPAATVTVADAKTLAESINSDRIFIAFPNAVNSAGVTLDGAITAAGVASVIMTETNDPALPVNGVAISGFGGLAMKLMSSEESDLASSGVTALYPENSVPTIYRLVTSAKKIDGKDSIWHDATTRFIADEVLRSVEDKLRANYKRTKNVSRVLNSIKTDVIGVLEDKEGLEIIKDFDKASVSVIQDPKDIYGALVDYEFRVVTPLYTITITQHMKV